MIVVGIHNTGILSSAALVADGKLVFGCAEERLNRNKYFKHFPRLAVDACLRAQGLTLADVDCFAVGWNPAINIGSRYRAGFSEWPAYPGERLYANPNHILPQLGERAYVATDQSFASADGRTVRFTYVTHHLAHLYNAFLLSGLSEAVLFSCDGYSERATAVWAVGREGKIEILREIDFPHSLGSFYSAITEHLGFRPDLDEWKVMGAAAYGDPTRYADAMRTLLRAEPEGSFSLNLDYFDHFNFDTAGLFSTRIRGLLGEPRSKDSPLEPRHYDLAAAAQARLEEILFATLTWLRQRTGLSNLCFSGGVAMNSAFNGRLTLEGPFERVYVPFAPDDSGNSIGAALYVAARASERIDLGNGPASPYLGTAYSDDEVRRTIERFGLRFREVADPTAAAADLLADGKVVGWFQGRMEFGQRALGSRSILADARDGAMKDRVNAAVKYRESFRPFAPAVLLEAVDRFFEAPAGCAVPYMEKVFPIRPQMRQRIPAVVHADGTGRLQTVSRDQHALFHRLIEAFNQRTGIPVVLNTSFNLNGEPIVESPADAIRTYASSGMDALVAGRCVLDKAAA